MLRRAGLRDATFIAMSNYYYEEKNGYLASLAAVRATNQGDLTSFLVFALRGVDLQARRLLGEIQREIKRELFRNLANDLFDRLKSSRRRIIAARQRRILARLLDGPDERDLAEFVKSAIADYSGLKTPAKALSRDLNGLLEIGAILTRKIDEKRLMLFLNLNWPEQITETEFFERIRKLPKARIPWE